MLITQQQVTGQNQQQRKDTEEGAMEKISINIFTKSQPTNFEFPKTKICKRKTGRLIHTGTQNFRGFTIV